MHQRNLQVALQLRFDGNSATSCDALETQRIRQQSQVHTCRRHACGRAAQSCEKKWCESLQLAMRSTRSCGAAASTCCTGCTA